MTSSQEIAGPVVSAKRLIPYLGRLKLLLIAAGIVALVEQRYGQLLECDVRSPAGDGNLGRDSRPIESSGKPRGTLAAQGLDKKPILMPALILNAARRSALTNVPLTDQLHVQPTSAYGEAVTHRLVDRELHRLSGIHRLDRCADSFRSGT